MANTAVSSTAQPFYGPNAGYVIELYERYLADPTSVDAETRAFFETWTPPTDVAISSNGAAVAAPVAADIEVILAAARYADAIRTQGHKAATIAPIGQRTPVSETPMLRADTHGISEATLSSLPASVVGGPIATSAANAHEAIEQLRAVYCGTIGYEFAHVQEAERRDWLRDAAETGRFREPLSDDAKRALLDRLTAVESFERFLHTTYLGAKRFSIEGTDSLVPVLDEIVIDATEAGAQEIVIGMAHRGRLNVLAHVLGKPYEAIFDEFGHYGHRLGASASESTDIGWTGDVKYHLGLRRTKDSAYGTMVDVPIIMSPNPSHLEYVNPVVEGMTRASQEERDGSGPPVHDPTSALAILLHGDAAFPGQGVVAETLNLSQLHGYATGGTVHIIVNNLIGYTTLPHDSRSTLYASDLAKGFEVPIIHVNADDPEACLAAGRLAIAYRNRFRSDVLIDLVGYRRWGHNEGDDPSITQPKMYVEINARPTVRALWAEQLEAAGVIPAGEGERLVNAALDRLQEIKAVAEKGESALSSHGQNGHNQGPIPSRPVETGVAEAMIKRFNDQLHSFPDNFTLNPKLARQLQRRRSALEREGGIDWAHAESLAFASIIAEGTPVRLTGQDAERGTFAQRHLVLHDPETGKTFTALQAMTDASTFAVYNSPLSEMAVLGFEYGYSVYAPETLVLWEAQFGDFANSAQVIIDQFIAAAEAKWRQSSSLVMLLPHGYEGQGPEHSSARLERFLQLAAGRNLRVANCTTSAQYFHLLRRQAATLMTDPRPLVVMTPKSLLRHPQAGSSLNDLVDGRFEPVLNDREAQTRADAITRVVLCSGKVYVDVVAHEAYTDAEDVAVVRVEELHPFPAEQLQGVLEGYGNLNEVVWLQEEPKNMGAWYYAAPRIRELLDSIRPANSIPLSYVGRPERASPAEGSSDDHAEEQSRIVSAAISRQLSAVSL
jgi:2-oxoglutarate dehydrogenase E1 component